MKRFLNILFLFLMIAFLSKGAFYETGIVIKKISKDNLYAQEDVIDEIEDSTEKDIDNEIEKDASEGVSEGIDEEVEDDEREREDKGEFMEEGLPR